MDDPENRTSYEDMEALVFGMDPADWAAILNQKMTAASLRLDRAVRTEADSYKELTQFTDEDCRAAIRMAASLLLNELYETLAAMPIMQMSPQALDGLHYIANAIADIERGTAPHWLVTAKPTRSHLAPNQRRLEQMSTVVCVQLLRLLPEFEAEEAAVQRVMELTGRANTTIKNWCRDLHCPTRHKHPEARERIEHEIAVARVLIKGRAPAEQKAYIQSRVDAFLPPV